MPTDNIGVLAVTALVGFLIISYITRRLTERREEKAVVQQARVREIRAFQEQLVKLRSESTRAKDDFQKAKEEYYAKYNRNRTNPNGDNNSNS